MQRYHSAQTSTSRAVLATLCGLLTGVVAAGAILYRHDGELVAPLTVSARECNIKGNISHRSGEKTFHLPASTAIPVPSSRPIAANAGSAQRQMPGGRLAQGRQLIA